LFDDFACADAGMPRGGMQRREGTRRVATAEAATYDDESAMNATR
jgi:hypothetical protein